MVPGGAGGSAFDTAARHGGRGHSAAERL